jgi:hypothetical protein
LHLAGDNDVVMKCHKNVFIASEAKAV